EIVPVAATHPNKGGNAPGIAPTNTAMEPTRFNGVYTKQYNTIDTIESNTVSTLVNTANMATLNTKHTIEKSMASRIDRRSVGNGLFMVRVMSLSKSFSNTWLMVTDAPDNKKPPIKSIPSVI